MPKPQLKKIFRIASLSLLFAALFGAALLLLLVVWESGDYGGRIRRTPLLPIGALVEGPARLQGEVEALPDHPPHRAPTGEACVYYREERLVVGEDVSGDWPWVVADKEETVVPFALRDATGAVRVVLDPQHLHYASVVDFVESDDERWVRFCVAVGATVSVMGTYDAATQRVLPAGAHGLDGMMLSLDDWATLGSHYPGDELIVSAVALAMLLGALLVLSRLLDFRLARPLWLLCAVLLVLVQAGRGVVIHLEDFDAAARHLEAQWQSRLAESAPMAATLGLSPEALLRAWPELRANSATELALDEHALDADDSLSLGRLAIAHGQARLRARRGLLSLWRGPALPAPLTLTPEEGQRLARLSWDTFEPQGLRGEAALFGALLLLAAAFFVFLGHRERHLARWLRTFPSSVAKNVVYGHTEISATAVLREPQQPLTSPLTATPCVYYHHLVQERQRSGGRRKWVTTHNQVKRLGYWLEDESGRVAVDPQGATFIPAATTSHQEGGRRETEATAPVGAKLYVFGFAKVRAQRPHHLEIAAYPDPKARVPFIISTLSEAAVTERYLSKVFVLFYVAFMLVFAAMLSLSAAWAGMTPTTYLASAFIPTLALLAGLVELQRRDLAFFREQLSLMQRRVEDVLAGRLDLLPLVRRHQAFADGEASAGSEGDADYFDRKMRAWLESGAAANATDPALTRLLEGLGAIGEEAAAVQEGFTAMADLYRQRLEGGLARWVGKIFRFAPVTLQESSVALLALLGRVGGFAWEALPTQEASEVMRALRAVPTVAQGEVRAPRTWITWNGTGITVTRAGEATLRWEIDAMPAIQLSQWQRPLRRTLGGWLTGAPARMQHYWGVELRAPGAVRLRLRLCAKARAEEVAGLPRLALEGPEVDGQGLIALLQQAVALGATIVSA